MKYKQQTGTFTMLKNNEQKNEILKKIFIYHDMKPTNELKQIWIEDLDEFSADQIQKAWNLFRADEKNLRYKPKSYDIVHLAKQVNSNHDRNYTINTKVIDDRPLQAGISYSEDILKQNIDTMNKNNKNLRRDLAACESVYEKMLICGLAMGLDLNKFSSLFIKLAKKYSENDKKHDCDLSLNETLENDALKRTEIYKNDVYNRKVSSLECFI